MFDNFINGMKNGFRAANATRKLVFSDKELFAYPLIAVLVSIVIAVLFLGMGIAGYLAGSLAGFTNGQLLVLFILAIIVLYFIIYFVTSYFTVAMLLAFREYGKGKKIGISDALGRTAPYAKLIIEWSIFYTIIATIVHIIEGIIRAALSRFGIAGNVISAILTGGISLGLAAAVAFALPVIIDEKTGPIQTIKSSVSFIVKNFSDTFGGLFFAELFEIAMILVGLGVIFLGILAAVSIGSLILCIILVALGILAIIGGVLLRYVLFNCFKLIIYDYKTRGKLPKGFDAKLIENSIKRKNNPKGGKFGINTFGVGAGSGEL